MSFSEGERQEITGALDDKINGELVCPVCHKTRWSLQDGMFLMPLHQANTGGLVVGGPILPCVAISCTNCGNTQLQNLLILGLNHIVERKGQ